MTYFFLLRALEKREEKAAMELAEVARERNSPIVSVAAIPALPGHIIVECERKFEILKLLPELKQIRGMVRGKISRKEVLELINQPVTLFEPDDDVSIVSGPLKGSRAKVIEDDGKSIVVQLMDWDKENKITLSRDDVKRRR